MSTHNTPTTQTPRAAAPAHTPCIVKYSDGSEVICSLEAVAKYEALYGKAPFEVRAIAKAEGRA